ncbi:MAG TPA: hypothetical protein VFA46_06320 [Actinomycetes bacterium]|nr:hypothetical protein [Actinomycetes bacterium]
MQAKQTRLELYGKRNWPASTLAIHSPRAEGWWEVCHPSRSLTRQPLAPTWTAAVGATRLPDGRLLHIQRNRTALVLVPPGQDALALVPGGEHQWTARSVSATVTFEYDRDRMPARLTGTVVAARGPSVAGWRPADIYRQVLVEVREAVGAGALV